MSKSVSIGQNFTIEDFAHMDLRTLIQILSTFMPIVRLADKQDAYLLGTEVKKMTVRKNDCMVSVGGGFMSVQEYYDQCSFKQNMIFYRHCKNSAYDGSFLKTLVSILRKSGTPQEVIAKYEAEDPAMWERVGELFMRLSDFANEKRKQEVKKQRM